MIYLNYFFEILEECVKKIEGIDSEWVDLLQAKQTLHGIIKNILPAIRCNLAIKERGNIPNNKSSIQHCITNFEIELDKENTELKAKLLKEKSSKLSCTGQYIKLAIIKMSCTYQELKRIQIILQ